MQNAKLPWRNNTLVWRDTPDWQLVHCRLVYWGRRWLCQLCTASGGFALAGMALANIEVMVCPGPSGRLQLLVCCSCNPRVHDCRRRPACWLQRCQQSLCLGRTSRHGGPSHPRRMFLPGFRLCLGVLRPLRQL